MSDLLFSDGQLDLALEGALRQALDEVTRWDEDQLLAQSETAILAYLHEKVLVEPPLIHRERMEIEEPRERVVRRRDSFSGGSLETTSPRVIVHVPFDGDPEFFRLRPNSYTLNPPIAQVTDGELILTYELRGDAAGLKSQIDHDVSEISRWLAWSTAQAEEHNARAPALVERAVRERKQRVLANRNLVSEIGIPVRRRSVGSSQAVPVARKVVRPGPTRPARVRGPFTPEPALASDDFEAALTVIRDAATQLERTPETARKLSEEERRDLLLVALNSHFEGLAGAEIFNGSGKTDVLIREQNRNVFIGECKIWSGPKAFGAAIDQLLGYAVWRDSKAALIVFFETQNASAAIAKAAEELAGHPRCLKVMPAPAPDMRQDFVFSADADREREIQLVFLPIVIRPGPRASQSGD